MVIKNWSIEVRNELDGARWGEVHEERTLEERAILLSV